MLSNILQIGEVYGACGTPPLAVLAARQEAKIILPPYKTWPFNPSYGIMATERLIQESLISPGGFSQAS